jgi:hypothetical protein
MKRPDWEAWEPEEPSPGFSERVTAAAMGEPRAARRAMAQRVLGAVVLAGTLAAAAALTVRIRHAHAHGYVVADARTAARVGTSATAVLEPGARIAWNGSDVRQDEGDVFWRVDPTGGPFVVHTPAGEVTVKGTCFRVRVLAGVGVTAVAIAVFVYEGKVGVSHAGTEVDLAAGESARTDEHGVHRTTAVEDEPAAPARDDAARAVARLDRAHADQMRRQLHAIFADAGARVIAPAPSAEPEASATPEAPTMPVLGFSDAGKPKIDPSYIQQRVREDLFPLAKGCYNDALKRDPTTAGKLVIFFRILGDRKVGGVVDEAKMMDDTTITDPEFQTCVRESMMSVSFAAPPNDGEVTVVYPITFSNSDDDGGSDE